MTLEAFVQEQSELNRRHTMAREEAEDQADRMEAEELERLRQVSLIKLQKYHGQSFTR